MGLKRWLALPCFAVALSASTGVWASPNFPDAVQEISGSDCAPSCLLCHLTNPGLKTTAIQSGYPFTFALISKGIGGGESDADIRAALIKMRDGQDTNGDGTVDVPPTDSDGDTMSDFDELAIGVNPNPGDAELCEITYGCGARIAPTPPSSNVALYGGVLTALGLALMGLRKRRC
jgi:hypothetical protein